MGTPTCLLQGKSLYSFNKCRRMREVGEAVRVPAEPSRERARTLFSLQPARGGETDANGKTEVGPQDQRSPQTYPFSAPPPSSLQSQQQMWEAPWGWRPGSETSSLEKELKPEAALAESASSG